MEDQLGQQPHVIIGTETPCGGGCSGRHNNESDACGSNDGDDADFLNSLPPGYRFKPTDEELISEYLDKKLKDEPLPPNLIKVVDLYGHNPQSLAESTRPIGGEEWYFFTPRDKKYPNGSRPNRAAGDGYWKATGADRPIFSDGLKIGCRKALVFYQGKAPRGNKTNWIMHEFRIESPPKIKHENCMRLDDWVLCKLYEKEEREGTEGKDDKSAGPSKRQKRNHPKEEPMPHQPSQVALLYNPYFSQGASSSMQPFPQHNNIVPHSLPMVFQSAFSDPNQVLDYHDMNTMEANVRLNGFYDHTHMGFNNSDSFQINHDAQWFSSFDDDISKYSFFEDGDKK